MSKRIFGISISIMAVVLAALIYLNVKEDNRRTWDTVHGMANSRIEWTGAGYSGIYGR